LFQNQRGWNKFTGGPFSPFYFLKPINLGRKAYIFIFKLSKIVLNFSRLGRLQNSVGFETGLEKPVQSVFSLTFQTGKAVPKSGSPQGYDFGSVTLKTAVSRGF
jgi:hypothetical protein